MTSVASIAISAATLQTATLSWMALLDVKDMFYMVCLQEDKNLLSLWRRFIFNRLQMPMLHSLNLYSLTPSRCETAPTYR